jgi:hypothetical protein
MGAVGLLLIAALAISLTVALAEFDLSRGDS